jgi:hypothetical protein
MGSHGSQYIMIGAATSLPGSTFVGSMWAVWGFVVQGPLVGPIRTNIGICAWTPCVYGFRVCDPYMAILMITKPEYVSDP